jgi:rubrerythrin
MGVVYMMSDIPASIGKMRADDINREVIRVGMIAELDAISLYEQMAAMATHVDIKKVLMNIAKEEKTHLAEFETLLLRFDKEQVEENEKGRVEVEELTGRK